MWLRFTAGIALAPPGASFSSFSRFLAEREATPLVKRSGLRARFTRGDKRETFGLAKWAKRASRAIHQR